MRSLARSLRHNLQMAKYKNIVSLVLALMLSLPLLFGQEEQRPRRTPQEEAAKQTAMLAQYLTLTQQQIDTIYTIHLKYANLRREPSQADNRRVLFEQMIYEVKQILTSEQIVALEKMQEENKRAMQGRRVMFRDSIASAPAQ